MLISRHILCGLLATAALVPPALCGARALDAPATPDANNVAAAYTTLRRWTDAIELPKPADAASQVKIDGASGVSVIVRRSGRMLGSGADSAGDDLMLRRATAQALGEALSDKSVSALPEDLRIAIGPSLTVELEVAGRLTPLVGRDLKQLAARIEPGLDGIAIRRGQKLFALFPSQMRSTNIAGDTAARMISLAVKAGLDAAEIEKLSQLPDVTVFSFRTVHLMQPAPIRSPIQTFRGDVVVPQSSVTREAVIELADEIAAHLMAGMFPEPIPSPETEAAAPPPVRNPVGLMGSYRPFADIYEPLIAPPLEQALGALALLRYSQCAEIDREKAAAASACAVQILKDLAEVTVAEDSPFDDPAATAAIVYAVTEQPSLLTEVEIAKLFDNAVTRILQPADGTVDVSPHGLALTAGALCRVLLMNDDRPDNAAALDASAVRSALDRAWQSVPAHQRIALLPWIGWAESDFTRATGTALAHADDLRMMRDTLNRSRINENSGAPPDLVGGLALTTSPAALDRPAADAQTLRPAAWLATIVLDERLTPPGESAAALQAQLQTVRFIMQLTARDPLLVACRNPDRARGGVRAALWDLTQPVPAQALALITAVKTIQAMPNPAAKP